MIPKPLSEIACYPGPENRRYPGGKAIEYKRELPGTRDEDKREFLADASSFANTEGPDHGVIAL